MKIVNLTPHPVHLIQGDETHTFPPSGIVARAEQIPVSIETVTVDDIGSVRIHSVGYGAPVDLPDPQPDTLFIVSSLTAQAARDRDDLVVPHDPVRDDNGVIVGCRGFARI